MKSKTAHTRSVPKHASRSSLSPDFQIELITPSLSIARVLWRRYPHLIEEAELREPFRSAIESNGELEIGGEQILRELPEAQADKATDAILRCAAGDDNRELRFLETCQRIYRANTGCNTPFEDFFWYLVGAAEHGFETTPDFVKDKFEEFERNFEDMVRDASAFVRQYPSKFPDLKISAEAKERVEAA